MFNHCFFGAFILSHCDTTKFGSVSHTYICTSYHQTTLSSHSHSNPTLKQCKLLFHIPKTKLYILFRLMNHAMKVSFFDYHICTNCVFDSIQMSRHKWAWTSMRNKGQPAQTRAAYEQARTQAHTNKHKCRHECTMAGVGTCRQQWDAQTNKGDSGHRQTRQVQTNEGVDIQIRWSVGPGTSECDSTHDEHGNGHKRVWVANQGGKKMGKQWWEQELQWQKQQQQHWQL